MPERARGRLVEVESAGGAHPRAPLAVAEQADDGVVLQAGAVGLVVQERVECVSVVDVEAVVGARPDGTLLVLAEARDEAAGKTVGRNEKSTLCAPCALNGGTCNE